MARLHDIDFIMIVRRTSRLLQHVLPGVAIACMVVQILLAAGVAHAMQGDCGDRAAVAAAADHAVMDHAAHGMAMAHPAETADPALDDDPCAGCDMTSACGAAPALPATFALGFGPCNGVAVVVEHPLPAGHAGGADRRPPRLI